MNNLYLTGIFGIMMPKYSHLPLIDWFLKPIIDNQE